MKHNSIGSSLGLTALLLLFVATNGFAQAHSLQVDDGAQHYSTILGSNPGGTYTLAPGGGTILTTGGGGPSLAWLTAGNILSGGTPSTPTQFMGSTNNFDVIFRSNNQVHMTLGTNGYLSLVSGTPAFSPTVPLQLWNVDNTPTPPIAIGQIVNFMSPSTTIASGQDALFIQNELFNSSANMNGVLDGIRQQTFLNSNYTGTLAYAQGGNFSISDLSPSTLANADGVVGSIYAQGSTAANIITNARGSVGQVFNQGPGNIFNEYSFWSRTGNSGGGTITNSYLYYGVNPANAGITNLTGLYLEQLTGATNINAINYAHATLPFVVSGAGNVGIGTATPGVGAKLSFGQTTGSPADIYFWDNAVAASKYGIGMQASELQNFVPTASHFSWNGGGDLNASGTNEWMRMTSSQIILTMNGSPTIRTPNKPSGSGGPTSLNIKGGDVTPSLNFASDGTNVNISGGNGYSDGVNGIVFKGDVTITAGWNTYTMPNAANMNGSISFRAGFNAPEVLRIDPTANNAFGSNSTFAFNGAAVGAGNTIVVGTGGANGNGALLTNGGAWTNGSSRNFKERFSSLNGEDVLSKIKGLNVLGWYYKGTNEYHIGPIAEDFYATFRTGNQDYPSQTEKYISSVDPAGIALVGVQQLSKQVDELRKENADLRKELDEIKAKLK